MLVAETRQQLLQRLSSNAYLGSEDHKTRVHYDWEELIRPDDMLKPVTMRQLDIMAYNIVKFYAKAHDVPKIGYTKHITFPCPAATIAERNVIGFAKDSPVPPTFALFFHEFSHILDIPTERRKYDAINGGHGPSFIGIVIDLYSQFGGANRQLLEHQAHMMKLPFDYSGRAQC